MEPTPCRLTSLGTSLDTPQMRTSVRFGPAAEGFGEAWGVGCWSRCLGGILSPLTAVMNDGRDPSRPQPAPSHTAALCGPHRGSGSLSMGTRGALCFCVPAFRMEDDHASCWGRSRRWSGWGAAREATTRWSAAEANQQEATSSRAPAPVRPVSSVADNWAGVSDLPLEVRLPVGGVAAFWRARKPVAGRPRAVPVADATAQSLPAGAERVGHPANV